MADATKTLLTLDNLSKFKVNYDTQIGYNGTEKLMTTAQSDKLAGIAKGAEVNVLNGVQVNGSDLPINAKKVNIDLSTYAKKADVAGGVRFKDTVETYANLPTSNQQIGDLYFVNTADPEHDIVAGEAVIWNGTAWSDLGGLMSVDLSNYYNKTEADGRFAPISHTHTVTEITDLEAWFVGKDLVNTTTLNAKLANYLLGTTANSTYQKISDMTNYVAKADFATQLAAAGGYDATTNPVATEEQIAALFD